MTSEKRNELKKVIRAILIADKSQGMPLRELERKYAEMEGKSMPLCGYPDTAALLYSLSDTVFTVCLLYQNVFCCFTVHANYFRIKTRFARSKRFIARSMSVCTKFSRN